VIRLGVCGWPVAHSRSPRMHNAALHALGLHDWRYQLLPLPPDRFSETVKALPAAGFRGVNVTIPHKQAALRLADRATEAAQAIGAANTLTFERDGAIHADNTDAGGLLAVLPRSAYQKRVLVLGAGGAARAAVYALKQAGAEVHVWNRTAARAEALADEFGVTASAELGEIVINCTAVGLEDPESTFKALPVRADDLSAGQLVVDMVYRRGGTLLLNTAKANGAQVVDGLEILVAQGAASFERWTGRTAPDQAMREAVADIAS
jgi:shikimate dehydrogenase